jgi:hypothetical protein
MSDCSGSPSAHSDPQPPKRKAAQAGLDGNTTGRSVKRRASKACQCCRARKVRCNVTEHGAPCTNCRLDEVECIVSESRRKKSVLAQFTIRQAPQPPCQISTNVVMQRIGRLARPFCRATDNALNPSRPCNFQSAEHHHQLHQQPKLTWGLFLLTFVLAGNGQRTTSTIITQNQQMLLRPTPTASSLRATL